MAYMDDLSRRKVLTATSVVVLILCLWVYHSLTGTRVPFRVPDPVKANQRLIWTQNTNEYSGTQPQVELPNPVKANQLNRTQNTNEYSKPNLTTGTRRPRVQLPDPMKANQLIRAQNTNEYSKPNLTTGTPRPRVQLPDPMKANQLIRPQNANKYSKLNITYDRIVLPESNLSDVFISVRTTSRFHESRLLLLLYTWLQTVNPKQVQIVTDSVNDIWINAAREAGFRVVMPPHCNIGHRRTSLCCKTGYELEQYYKATEAGKRYRWYCHFDDDEYVNIPVLVKTLHVHKDNYYLGCWPRGYWSKKQTWKTAAFPQRKRSFFDYATGAAVCISSVLMPQLERYIRGSSVFASTCEKLQWEDDVALAAIIEGILGHNLTEIPVMVDGPCYNKIGGATDHEDVEKLVTISYKIDKLEHKRVTIPGAAFTKEQDPTSFLSYHCLLYPSTSWCKQRPKKQTNPTITTMQISGSN